MASAVNTIDVQQGVANFKTQYAQYLVLKKDKQGREAALGDLENASGQLWSNWLEDTVLKILEHGHRRMLDNRAAPLVTGNATSGGGTVDFTLDVKSVNGRGVWLKVVSDAASVGGVVEFFSDAARTKLVYQADIKAGSPPVDSDTLIDGTSWTAIADDGTDLESGTLYGRVTNNGGSDSTYTVTLVFEGA